MFAVAPTSVMLIGLIGMVIVAISVTRMTILERKIYRSTIGKSMGEPMGGPGRTRVTSNA